MQALRFTLHPLRYAAAKAIGTVWPGVFISPLGCLAYGSGARPALPAPDWVRINTTMGGICGSDLSLITLQDSPSLSPFASFPFVIGHENVGVVSEVGEAAGDWKPGDRVIADPLLSCSVRGFEQLCAACEAGLTNQCTRFTDGLLPPGLLIGNCRDTGGSWGECFVAHRSQLIRVPDNVSDENAVLAEPLGCALHAVDMAVSPPAGGTALVIGGGVIGLATIAALTVMQPDVRIVAIVRHSFQADMARRLGAHNVITGRGAQLYGKVADALGARLLRPVLGPPVLVGGADVVYECAGSAKALADGLRFTAPGGQLILLGLASLPKGIDWSHVWRKEIHVQGVFAAGPVHTEKGRMSSLRYALDLFRAGRLNLEELVTHRFPLSQYRQAFAAVTSKGRTACVKAVFIPSGNS